MRVRTYLILLILGYSICGLTVFYMLNALHHDESRLSKDVSRSRLILRDVKSLERNLSHWMLLSDLVLGADESYLCDGAIGLGGEVDSILQNLSNETDLVAQPRVLKLKEFSARQKDRLLKSRTLSDSDRHSQLDELLSQMDADSDAAIDELDNLDNEAQSTFERNRSELDSSLSKTDFTTRLLLVAFLGSALLLWRWISSIVSQPISMLARQSRIKEGVRNFKVKSTAPHEVQQLAGSLSELVSDLEYQIEEHKKTEVERGRLHRKLMGASRRAGMADVASEVLHNVGNVLNSLNVSATVIRNSLQMSLAPKLAVANREFSKHADDYGDYLEKDERGKHFPAALDYMSEALVADHNSHMDEAELLLKNIAHVRSVIEQQLTKSHDKGVFEEFALADLIEECININRDKAKRYDAVVNLKCPRTLNIETDRHRLQQVLINLISNALDAVRENASQAGQIDVLVSPFEDENIEIKVVDNGMGIPRENLTKIFSQGFTTKDDGHGLGLHSCALTAQMLGGNIDVSSEGAGLGSCFRIVIPLRKTELCKV